MQIEPAIITSIVALVGGLASLWFRMESKINEERRIRESQVERFATDSMNRFLLIQRELVDHKLFAAESYVKSDALRDTEERLVVSMDKLGANIEKLSARIDRIPMEMRKTP